MEKKQVTSTSPIPGNEEGGGSGYMHLLLWTTSRPGTNN